MKTACLLFSICSLSFIQLQPPQKILHPEDQNRFRIVVDDRVGFINTFGEIVIAPVFRNANSFSEGLCAARKDGRFGFIDIQGNFVIAPQYDFATQFREGFAVAFQDGKPFYIDRKGNRSFDNCFQALGAFEDGRAYVRTYSNKMGVINTKGELLIDTTFSHIGRMIDHRAIVRGLPDDSGEKKLRNEDPEYGLIDEDGKFVVPLGKYKGIEGPTEGFYSVQIQIEYIGDDSTDDVGEAGFIDRNGVLVMSYVEKNDSYLGNDVFNGLARINLSRQVKKEDADEYSGEDEYQGFIDLNGKLVFDDPEFEEVTNFSENRAFVKRRDGQYSLINPKGEFIVKDGFTELLSTWGESIHFKNNAAFVATDDGWGLIDTLGNFLIKPHFEGIEESGFVGDYFFFTGGNPQAKSLNERYYGVADRSGNVIVNSIMADYDREGFVNGLLECVIDKKRTFVNEHGKVIWQAPPQSLKEGAALNIDYMNRGYCYARSLSKGNNTGHGYSEEENYPKRIQASHNFVPKALSFVLDSTHAASFFERHTGFALRLGNTTNRSIFFNAQDGRLYMKMQALSPEGLWLDIEYLPSSWCGNSYHTLKLNPGTYWSFVIPRYEGDFKTRLRMEIRYINPKRDPEEYARRSKDELVLYSPEFEGSINPGQFWRQNTYIPSGIMDPYNN